MICWRQDLPRRTTKPIFASALILFGLVFGVGEAKRVAPPVAIEKMIAIGLLVYAGTGVVTMLLGGNFLDYDVLQHDFLTKAHILPAGQHLGIFVVELGVGITVSAVMTMVFYAFTSREPAK